MSADRQSAQQGKTPVLPVSLGNLIAEQRHAEALPLLLMCLNILTEHILHLYAEESEQSRL